MKCPICKQPVQPEAPETPFCSQRCRLIDLGNWASGKYVISTPAPLSEIARHIGNGSAEDRPNEEENGG